MIKKFFFLVIFAFIFSSACAATEDPPAPTLPIQPLPSPTFDPQAYSDACSTLTVEPTPAPNADSYFPPVSPADFSFGPADAPVTLLEYCDFQTNSCRVMADSIAKLMKNRSNARFVFRPYPLIGRLDKSDKAVMAALAADEQGKFWTMYDFLFVTYSQWDALKPEEFNDWVVQQSAQAGIDSARLEAALNDPKTATRMTSLYESASKLNIPAVPLLLINGRLQQSYLLEYQSLADMVDLIALGQKQFGVCPPFEVETSKQYTATLHTQKGDIVLQLFPEKAPLAVNSFIFLARQGWFNGVTFHHVVPGFIAQTGDPSGTGMGNPGYFFKTEISDLKFDQPGMVGMANSGIDANGSQFFIAFAPQPQLDGAYTLFGRVTRGLDVAERLAPRDSRQAGLPPGDVILSVDIEIK
ncbi:MAG: hypothetical protein Fur002_16770 [Anaerolineales bacterium]